MSVKNIDDTYQLSPMQQGMLFHYQLDPRSGVDIEQMLCSLHEELNVSALQKAWEQVLMRHPTLRTSFRWEGIDEPLQHVHSNVSLPFEKQDWRNLSSVSQQSKLEEYLKLDRQRGFDLTKAPAMRLALFRLGDADYKLVWTFHHIIADGRSHYIILNEVFTFYDANCQGHGVQLKPPRPYRDHIDWLQQKDSSESEVFWRRLLSGFTAPTAVDAIAKTESLNDGKGDHAEQEIQIAESFTSCLETAARQHHVTLNTLVQGAWALLLSRYTGEDDVVFGAVRACRRSTVKGAESIVGLFINTVPVRVRISSDQNMIPWLRELREQHIAVRDHEQTPLVQVMGWSDVHRSMPLFESIIVFDYAYLNSRLREQGGSWRNREFHLIEKTGFPLALSGFGGAKLSLKISYDGRRFDDATIERMLGHLKTLLEGMAKNLDRPLATLPILTETERHQLLVEWNNTQVDYPQHLCIHQLFEAQAERTPDAVAVVFEDKRLTYRELNRRANQLAHYLRRLGVGPEVLVGVFMERSLEMVIGLCGILKAGGAYVPLDPAYPKERLAFMLTDAQVPVLLTQEKLLAGLPEQKGHLVCLDTDWEVISQESEENPVSGVTAENLAYVIYTSGSTGRPKGTLLQHRGLCNLVNAQTRAFGVGADSRVLQFASFSFDASVSEIFMALLRGATLYLAKQDTLVSSVALLELLRDQAITTVTLPPSILSVLPAEGLPALQTVISAGESCSWDVVACWAPGRRFFNAYGPTEATIGPTLGLVESVLEGVPNVPIGRPIDNTQIYLLDSHLQPVPVGVPGEVHIGGVGLARGYLNRPELTAEKFIPNPFSDEPGARLYKTGDLARYLSDGNIEFLGRIDHQVKFRGFRIELGEIKAVLGQHPAVRETVAIVREDHPGNKCLVAYVVPNQELSPSTSELRNFLKQKLPNYMVPSAFVILETLPLTPNGKVDRRALPAPDGARPELEATYVAPRTEAERAIAIVWQEVLNLKNVGIHDNFFDLGGHSLLMAQVQSKLRQVFDRDISIVEMFQYPTIGSLSKCLSHEQNEPPSFQKIHDRAKRQKEAINRQKQLREQRRRSQ